MVTLSEQDKVIVDAIVDFITKNPGRDTTSKKLIVSFCEHLMNMTYPLKEPTTQIPMCRLTKTLVFEFEERLTKEKTYLCTKCRMFHSQQQIQRIGEIVNGTGNENPGLSS